MNIPLNIDWQQILLHWLNLAILVGGLYFILFKPVKQFMEKRAAYYKELDQQAAQKLEQAESIKAQYQAKLDGVEVELHEARQKAQLAVQQSAEEQIKQAQAQARQIVAQAQAQAEHSKEKAIKDAHKEVRQLAMEAAEMLAFHPEVDPFDQFLDTAEGGAKHDKG